MGKKKLELNSAEPVVFDVGMPYYSVLDFSLPPLALLRKGHYAEMLPWHHAGMVTTVMSVHGVVLIPCVYSRKTLH